MIREWAEQIVGYPGLLLFCAVSGIAIPLPEDVSLLYAGIKIANGTWDPVPAVAAALLGVGLRDVLAWGMGRVAGESLLRSRWALRFIGERKLDRASELVKQHGAVAILVGRFLVGFRAPIFLVAGAARLPLRKFLLWDGLGLLVAVPVVIWMGYAFGESVIQIFSIIARSATSVILVSSLMVLVWLWRRWLTATN